MSEQARIVPFPDVKDWSGIATEFATSLSSPINADILLDFPGTVARYTGRVETVRDNLEATASECADGSDRQQFIVMLGQRAVGLSAVQFTDTYSFDYTKALPVLTGFILQPYRGKGLGSFSLRTRLTYVDRYFQGQAWTKVRDANVVSRHMVSQAGFVRTLDTVDDAHIYRYSKGHSLDNDAARA